MTNPTPHGQQLGGCPDCGSRNCVARECTRTVSHKAQAPNQLGGFSSGDMASAAAQGFRDGLAAAQTVAEPGTAYAALPDEGEPWRGHKFKEVQRGCWRCDCGKTIKEVTSDQSTPASGGNYPVMPKRYTVDDDGEELFTAEKMRAFADATHTLRASHGQAPAHVLHLVQDAFAEVAMAYPKAFALHKVGLADTAVRKALATPSPQAAQQAPAGANLFDEQGFRDWVLRNLPDDTIIGNGAWWADHLTERAKRFMKAARAAPSTPASPTIEGESK